MDIIQFSLLSLLLLASVAWLLHEFWQNVSASTAEADAEAAVTSGSDIPDWLRRQAYGPHAVSSAIGREEQEMAVPLLAAPIPFAREAAIRNHQSVARHVANANRRAS